MSDKKKSVAKSNTNKSTKNTKPSQTKPGVKVKQGGVVEWVRNNKVKAGVIIAASVLFVVVVAVLIVLVIDKSQPRVEEQSTDAPEVVQQVDYNQKVTGEDGGEFKASYELGSKANFAVRFAELKCTNDKCENIDDVKLGDKSLQRGKDYEVKQGSVIIVILADTLEDLKVGKYDLVFEIAEGDKTIKIGVKITIEDNEPTCADGQVLEDGQCVDKPTEATGSQSGTSSSSSASNNTQKPTTSTSGSQSGQASAAQTACERRTAPTAFLMVVWLTESQKQAWMEIGQPSDIVAIGEMGTLSGAKMVWRDGRCQPSIKSGMAVGGLRAPRNLGYFPPMIQANVGRNAVVWLWDDGSSEVEFVNDPDTFIYNHF